MEVRILGPLDVRTTTGEVALGGLRQRAVLAMLILRRGQVVSTEALIDGLWGDRVPDTATNTVQAYVSRLRKVLAPGFAPGSVELHRRSPGYLLEWDPQAVDLARFDELSRRGAALSMSSPAEASVMLSAAEQLWRGPPLAEFAREAFAVAERPRLLEAYLGTVCTRVETDLQLGHHRELIGELENLVAVHPFNEMLRRHLMVSLYRSGRPADALQAFQRVRSDFVEQLGLDPSRALVDLESAILRHDRDLEWHPPPAGAAVAAIDPDRAPAPVVRPATIRHLPLRNPYFTGRTGLIAELRRQFRDDGRRSGRQTLFGMGGVGKSQIAAEYAHVHSTAYRAVWWIDAQQPVLIPDQLVTLGARLGLDPWRAQVDVVEAVLSRLAATDDWLLVFDNAEHPDHIIDYLPSGGGDVLVTSRFPGWGAVGPRHRVEVPPRTEIVELLQIRIPLISPTVAAELADELGDLPLAAAQAAAHVEESGLDAADYLRQFRSRRADLLAAGDVLGYQGRVDTTWVLALERLAQIAPTAIGLLEVASLLAPEPVPLQLFSNRPVSREGTDDGDDGDDGGGPGAADRLSDAVGAAVALSLVARHTDGFRMHRLLQVVVSHRMPPARREQLGGVAVTLLIAARPGDPTDPLRWAAYAQLAPHILAAAPFADRTASGRALLLDTVGYLNLRGDARAASGLARELTDRWRRTLGSDDPMTLMSAALLTSVLAWLGEGAKAVHLGDDTLARCRTTLGPDHPVTLGAATYLTSALAFVGNGERAATLGLDTLERCRHTLGADHPTTLTSAGQWSFTLLGLGRLDAAVALTGDTVDRAQRMLGPWHPATLTACCARTFAQSWSGGAADACRPAAETLSRCRQAVGVDHWLSLVAAAGLTFALAGAGRPGEAREVGQVAADRAQLLLGADHWVALVATAALTAALVGAGDLDTARRIGRDGLDRSVGSLGEAHPVTSYLRDILGIPADGTC